MEGGVFVKVEGLSVWGMPETGRYGVRQRKPNLFWIKRNALLVQPKVAQDAFDDHAFSDRATMRISREQVGQISGSTSHTFLISSRHLGDGGRRLVHVDGDEKCPYTVPTFPVYMLCLVTRGLKAKGGPLTFS